MALHVCDYRQSQRLEGAGWSVLATLVADQDFKRVTMSVTPNAGCVDVVIVAPASRTGRGYWIIERNPQLTYTILEGVRGRRVCSLYRHCSGSGTLSFLSRGPAKASTAPTSASTSPFTQPKNHGIDRPSSSTATFAQPTGTRSAIPGPSPSAERRAQALPQPVRVLRQQLLRL